MSGQDNQFRLCRETCLRHYQRWYLRHFDLPVLPNALKKAIEPLENNGDSARQVAEYLKRLVHDGDLDRVSAFLEKVKQEGGVV